jgi:hypothetical protein
MGRFITASFKVHGRTPERLAPVRQWLMPFHEHLRDAGRGCMA